MIQSESMLGALAGEGVYDSPAETDNAQWRGATDTPWFGTTGWISAGDALSTNYDMQFGLRFTSVGVPAGATITGAYVEFTPHSTIFGNDPDIMIMGEDADDPPTFSNNANYEARVRTTTNVLWSPSGWSALTEVNTTDIKTVIQVIVDRGGWATGQSMVIFFNHSTAGWAGAEERILAYSHNIDDTLTPRLFLTWADPAPSITLSSPADDVSGYVNKNTTFQVTPAWYGATTASKIEIWTNDTGTWENTTEILSFTTDTLTDIVYNFTSVHNVIWNAIGTPNSTRTNQMCGVGLTGLMPSDLFLKMMGCGLSVLTMMTHFSGERLSISHWMWIGKL